MCASRSSADPGVLVVVSQALLRRDVSKLPHLASSLPGAHLSVLSFVTIGMASSLERLLGVPAAVAGGILAWLAFSGRCGAGCSALPWLLPWTGALLAAVETRPPNVLLQLGQNVLRHWVHT